ncbi:hypothetical protein BC835DRAFT_573200 [Cytidiella melzeri]|nr:hypothetical protein BC835DRAFT_573200 [Cytidiella melzeri]
MTLTNSGQLGSRDNWLAGCHLCGKSLAKLCRSPEAPVTVVRQKQFRHLDPGNAITWSRRIPVETHQRSALVVPSTLQQFVCWVVRSMARAEDQVSCSWQCWYRRFSLERHVFLPRSYATTSRFTRVLSWPRKLYMTSCITYDIPYELRVDSGRLTAHNLTTKVARFREVVQRIS